MPSNKLVLGAGGQIGTELIKKLKKKNPHTIVVAGDIKEPINQSSEIPYEHINALDKGAITDCIKKYKIDEVYLLATLLSATSELHPKKAWELNMNSLFNVLDIAKEGLIKKVFWPSSIAVFGTTTPRINTPQTTIIEPSTVYGISKLAGERWCEYYSQKYKVDVRSIRYPGVIGWKYIPSGGTTDFAVEMFVEALKNKKYCSYLKPTTKLPMIYIDDAIEATIQLMEAESEKIKIRSSYNLGAISFSPEELSDKIKTRIPDFEINYQPDYRQPIADSWPQSIDDSAARLDWDWNHKFDLEKISDEMILNLSKNELS